MDVTFLDNPFQSGNPSDVKISAHSTSSANFTEEGWDANAEYAYLTCTIVGLTYPDPADANGGYPAQVTSECTFRTKFDTGAVMVWEGLELLDIGRGFGGEPLGPDPEFSEYSIVGGTKEWAGATGEVRIVCEVGGNPATCTASGYVCKSAVATSLVESGYYN